jgi:hypothetical protein
MLRTYLSFRALRTLARGWWAPLEPPPTAGSPPEARGCADAEMTRWLYVRASLQFATLHRARLAARTAPCAEHALTAGTPFHQRRGHLPMVHVRSGDETR